MRVHRSPASHNARRLPRDERFNGNAARAVSAPPCSAGNQDLYFRGRTVTNFETASVFQATRALLALRGPSGESTSFNLAKRPSRRSPKSERLPEHGPANCIVKHSQPRYSSSSLEIIALHARCCQPQDHRPIHFSPADRRASVRAQKTSPTLPRRRPEPFTARTARSARETRFAGEAAKFRECLTRREDVEI